VVLYHRFPASKASSSVWFSGGIKPPAPGFANRPHGREAVALN